MLNLFLFERFLLQKQNFILEWIQVLENFTTYFIFDRWKRIFLLILALMWKLFIYFLKLVNFKLDFTITRYYLLLSGLKILFTISRIHCQEVHNKSVTLTLAMDGLQALNSYVNYKEYSLYGGSLYLGTTVERNEILINVNLL